MKILKGLEYKILKKNINPKNYEGIAYNSKEVSSNYIFVAIKGFKQDGHNFINEAISNGATLIVVEHEVEIYEDITLILVKDSREALSLISSNFYNWPQKSLNLIGVTGTNGKTTTAFLIYKSLKEAAFIGTIGIFLKDKKMESNLTTPESLDLIKIFKKCTEDGIKYVAMEISSHSLTLKRVHNLEFKIAIFTNLTDDHLDFHKTMESYFEAKSLIFSKVSKDGHILVNKDSPYYSKILEKVQNVKTFSAYSGDMVGKIEKFEDEKSHIILNYKNENYLIKTALILEFNLYNIMAAFYSLILLNINSNNEIIKNLEAIKEIKGRVNLITKNKRKVVIDFAHSPDSIEKVCKGLKEIFKSVVLVFGAGGERYKEVRAKFASSAAKYADKIILTSDNPRGELLKNILDDLEKGLIGIGYKNYKRIEDRREAITSAIKNSSSNEVVLVTGKGHQNYELISGKKIEFNEKEIIEKALNEL